MKFWKKIKTLTNDIKDQLNKPTYVPYLWVGQLGTE